MRKDADGLHNGFSLLGCQRRGAELLLAMRKRAVVAMTPGSVLAASSTTLVTCEATVLLTQGAFEDVGMVEHLILCV